MLQMNKPPTKDASKSSESVSADKVRELKFKYWMQTKALKEKALEVASLRSLTMAHKITLA